MLGSSQHNPIISPGASVYAIYGSYTLLLPVSFCEVIDVGCFPSVIITLHCPFRQTLPAAGGQSELPVAPNRGFWTAS